ncbi:fibronectin type III domain-containing protein [Chryseobacterium daeguense]|uniref:fibronectin type III domain-containing protein n=1 Tax=Chryseobacterium daeguense TaxID=412438 RepID=UPI000421205F|nr:fibronectin type III domain-containing protein [Chryseobacterium daeguense]
MKKILLFFFLALSYAVNAQISGYSFAQSTGTYTPLSGTPTVLATATGNTSATSLDNAVYPVTLPFGFSFNGSNYTSINVSTNGFITFGATAPGAATYSPISSTETYAGAISAWGKDLNTVFNIASVTGNISWGVEGTAPNREIVIQWSDFRPTYTTSTTNVYTMSFQIRLRETTNTIAVVYKNGSYLAGSSSISSTVQVGLRGATNADYNNRNNSTSTLYTSSTQGTANNNSQSFNTTATPGMPTSGLTYTWTPPSCFGPSGFVSTGMTTTSASVSWTAPATPPANGYEIYYSTTTTPPATPQVTGIPSTSTSYVIPGLSPSTTYYVWIRAKCSPTDQSALIGPLTVYTGHCLPTGGAYSTNYYLNNVTTTGGWTNVAYTASSYQAYVNSPAVVMSSPGFSVVTNLAAAGGSTYYYYVWVDWNNDLDFNDPGETILATTSYASTGTATIAIPAGQALGNYKVRTATSYSGAITACGPANYGNYVDFTLSVVAPPTCLPPTGLTTLNTTTTSTTIQWTVPTPAPAGGYDVYYNTTGTAPNAGTTPQYTGVAGPSQLIGGLTPSTTYYIWVRAKCSGSDISYWSGPLTVYTNYCAPTGGSSSTNNYLKTITTTNGFTNLNYTATSYSAYVNSPATTFSALPGTTVNVSMNAGTSTYYYYLWIDWNNDMVFNTPGETVLATTNYATNATTTINTVGHPSGSYRARFATSYSGQINPCGPAPYGNYVDFTFIIRPCSTTAPTNVTTTAVTYNSATVNWTPSPDNLGYKVYWRKQGTTGWPNSSAVIAPPATNYNITTGLDPATAYEVMVVAVCNTTEGTATPVVFTTKCDPTPPNVTISNITPTSAMITWAPLAASSSYYMRYRIVGSGNAGWSANIALPAAPANTYVIPGLSVYTTYEVQVANKCNGETTLNPWSNPKVFTTERTCEIAPPGLTITNLTTTTAEVTWDPFPGATYILRYRKVGISSWTNVPSATNTVTLTGLIETTQYEMQVVNICSGTPGTYTQPYIFTTPTIVYCDMESTMSSSDYISKVTVTPNGKPVMENQSQASNYTDYTGVTNKFIELIQGSSNNQITIEKKLSGGADAGVAVWIDFNRNGYFDINERVLVSGPNNNDTATGTFTVPSDAFISMTDYKYVVMRVALQKGAIPVNCTSFPDGEVEDYTVRITKPIVPNALNQTEILIYPNPVKSVLNVKNVSKRANYKIYNAAGQIISSGIILNNKIDVHTLTNGVYVIDIDDAQGTAQKKFIKE